MARLVLFIACMTNRRTWQVRRGPPPFATAAAILVLAGGVAHAQSLDSLIARAMKSNPRIVAARAAQAAAAEAASPAGALPDPMLMLRAYDTPIERPSPTNADMAGVELTQMLPFPGKRGLMRASMREESAMLGAQADRVALDVVAELREAYAEHYALSRKREVLRSSIDLLTATAAIVRTRYEVGAAPMQDLLKMMVELEEEKNRLVVLDARVPGVIARIQGLVGGAAYEALGAPALPDTVRPASEVADLESEAMATQPMIRMRERALAQAEVDLRLAAREGLPDLTIGAEYMANRDMPDTWTAMFGFNIPIWRGSRYRPMVRSAEQRKAAAIAELEQSRNETRVMVAELAAMLQGSRSMVNLYRSTVMPRAEQSLDAARAAYQTDRIAFMDLLDAHRSLLGFRLMAEDAMAEHLVNLARLDRELGRPATASSDPKADGREIGDEDER